MIITCNNIIIIYHPSDKNCLLLNVNWHNIMIVVCTVKHPKKTDTMAMMTPSLAPNWNDSVGVWNTVRK